MNMKIIGALLFVCCILFGTANPQTAYAQTGNTQQGNRQPVNVIFDTDMESDVDDVGALAMLHGLADAGDAKILATMVSSLNPWSVPTVDVVNTFLGRPDIPIGGVKTFGVYRNSQYAATLTEEYPQDIGLGEDAPDAVNLYREVLSEQPDNSVIIVTVGYLTNLSYLLNSKADDISPLAGEELIQKKVKHIVVMGDRYPYSPDPAKWGNFKPDPAAINDVADNWPTKIIFTGGGDFADRFKTGTKTFDYEPDSNPVSRAYDIFLESWGRKWHHSADFIAVYVAVRGWEDFFELRDQGYNHIFDNATSVWRLEPDNPNHQYINYLKEDIDPEKVTETFDALMMQPIKDNLNK